MQNTFLNMISQIDMPTLTLEEATKVRLMSRVDKKFWFRFSELENLLNAIKDDYYIQTVNGKKWQQYATQYFDTVDNKMYTLHHNGKLNRYKNNLKCHYGLETRFYHLNLLLFLLRRYHLIHYFH